jgi:hypothetical protein
MSELYQQTQFKCNSANTVNNTLVCAGKAALKSLAVSNSGGAAAFLKLYDKATAPAAGTDVPLLTIPVPTSGVVTLPLGEHGLLFEVGLGYAITNLVADSDTTAVAANQVKVVGGFAQ